MSEVFAEGRGPVTIALMAMNACCLFAWWGFNLWTPRLSLAAHRGRRRRPHHRRDVRTGRRDAGRHVVRLRHLGLRQRRRRPPPHLRVTYLIVAAILMLVYSATRNPLVLLFLGPFVAFFGTGYYSGLGAGDGGNLPHRHPRYGAGPLLQRRPHRQRRRAVRGRLVRAVAWLRCKSYRSRSVAFVGAADLAGAWIPERKGENSPGEGRNERGTNYGEMSRTI